MRPRNIDRHLAFAWYVLTDKALHDLVPAIKANNEGIIETMDTSRTWWYDTKNKIESDPETSLIYKRVCDSLQEIDKDKLEIVATLIHELVLELKRTSLDK